MPQGSLHPERPPPTCRCDPTVRSLASELGLAVNTVARAYRELESASLLETRGRAGTFVGANGDAGKARAADGIETSAAFAQILAMSGHL